MSDDGKVTQLRRIVDAAPGIGLAWGAGVGGTIGLAVSGGDGMSIGAGIGAGVGLVAGAAARALATSRPQHGDSESGREAG